MKEQDFEDILSKYPELIEEGLTLKGRQKHVRGNYVDLLFDDRHGHTLIVELKKGVIKSQHIAQLLDYEGHFLSPDDPTVRVMLIGNWVPPNLWRSLDHHGFEWREITASSLIEFLKEKDDKEFLAYFREDELETKRRPTRKKSLPREKKEIGQVFAPKDFLESSYFGRRSPTCQRLIKHLMRRIDALGMRHVMKVRGDNAVAISHITSPGRNFATVWPRQSWFVAVAIGHTGQEPYRSEEEIDSVLVPLIEKKYDEICELLG